MRRGKISNSRTFTLYTHWTNFCINLQLDHLISKPNPPFVEILQVYGHRVNHGHYYSQSNKLKADSVAMAWRAIPKTHLLEGLINPRKPHGYHAKNLEKLLTRILQHFSYQDPPPRQERAILIVLFMVTTEEAAPSFPFSQFLVDLIQIYHFFCLGRCKYTKTNSHLRTVQFRIKDMQFHDK